MKPITMMSEEKQNARVQAMLVARSERLKTKKHPRPDKYDEEMKKSEEIYRIRVRSLAKYDYAYRLLTSAGLEMILKPIDPSNDLSPKTGVSMFRTFSSFMGPEEDLVILMFHDVDPLPYIKVFENNGHKCYLEDYKIDPFIRDIMIKSLKIEDERMAIEDERIFPKTTPLLTVKM